MAELTTIIPEGWGGSLILIILALTLGPWAVFSKDHSDKWWALGRVTRWIRNRKIREIEDNSKLADATIQGHRDDRARWMQQMEDMRDEMEGDRSRFRDEIKQITAEASEFWEFITFIAAKRRELDLMAIRHGWDPPPEKWPSFDEWKQERRK
ncbi:hypothetical protein [Corynebacterium sp. A21]|uniref:hypothetical protein n=1 Tax=Corynebacterium sp. A21 TaxID=3457318 RepID=UPI003FD428AA